jgi:hypothetical protein
VTAVGVPVTAPVEASKLKPLGRVGVTLNVRGAVPPVVVTGV